jgi:hypothetical protein
MKSTLKTIYNKYMFKIMVWVHKGNTEKQIEMILKYDPLKVLNVYKNKENTK